MNSKFDSDNKDSNKSIANSLLIATGLIFGVCIIVAVINEVLSGPDLITSLTVSMATAFGPIAIITAFLKVGFDAVFYEAAVKSIEKAIKDERENLNKFRKELSVQLHLCQKHSKELIDNTGTLSVLRKNGITDAFQSRAEAYEKMKDWLNDHNNSEYVFVGTSFRGLYWPNEGDKSIYSLIKKRSQENITLLHDPDSLFFRFIFTHPAFAYLREKAEGDERKDKNVKIREEILTSVLMLRGMGIPEKAIKFFKGTPTMFGMMTNGKMFLNPYPYKKQSYTSFGLIVEDSDMPDAHFSLYKKFRAAHFEGVWKDTRNTETWQDDKLEDFWQSTITSIIDENLTKNIPTNLIQMLQNVANKKTTTCEKIAEPVI